MLTTSQIILRLLLSLIFGLVIFWFRKEKEKSLAPKIYPLFSLLGSIVALFSLKIFLGLYSKIDLTILPAVLILGIFLFGQVLIRKEETKETVISLVFLWLTSLIGLIIGFGFYELAIFSTLFILIFSYLSRYLKI